MSYSNIISNSGLGIWEWNVQTGETKFNEQWAEILGVTLEELSPVSIDTWIELTHPADLKKSNEKLREHFYGGIDQYQCAVRMRHKAGYWVWVRDAGRVIKWTNDGEPLIMSGIHQSIDKQKRAEEKLHQKLKIEKVLASISSKFIHTVDIDLTIHESFAKLSKLNGASRIYLFLIDDESKTMSNTHEWCASGVTAEKDHLQNLPLTTFPWWMKKLQRNEVIDIPDVSQMPVEAKTEREILEFQNIKSVLVLPIFFKSKLQGFIGFDNVEESSSWSFNDVYLLEIISSTISNALNRKWNEEKLASNLKNLRHFFDLHSDFVTILNEEGKIIRVNNNVSTKLGYKEEDLIGKSALILHPPEVQDEAAKVIENIIHNGKNSCLLPIITKTGQRILVETNAAKGYWDEKPAIFGISKDISDLKLSEEKFSKIFQNSPALISLNDVESGKCIEVNQAFYTTLGYSPNEVIGEKFFDITQVEEELKSQIRNTLQKSTSLQNAEGYFLHKDGNKITVILSASIIQILDKKYSLFIALDVTEKEHTKRQLTLLEKAIENSPASTLITDKNGIITYVNKGFEKMVGYSKEEVIGCPPSILNSGKHHKAFFTEMWDTILSGEIWQGEICNKSKKGEIFFANELITPLKYKNQITHFVSISQNITENKRLYEDLLMAKEKAEESNRLKSAFLATMSHELRTPLNHILGFSDMIPDMTDDESLKEFAKLIYDSGANLLNNLDDIFELAMIEQSKVTIRSEEVLLRNIYLEIKQHLREVLINSGKSDEIDLNFKLDNSIITKTILTDKSKIMQVTSNLIKNAVKFTDNGFISFELFLDKADFLSVKIKDSGVGIPKDKQKVIFHFFRQADDSHTREHEG
ncbi:MAG: PAS domain S-box protein, partial [Bacteroidota bacterium]